MKKLIIPILCLALFTACGNDIPTPKLSFTEGRILEKGESKDMLGVEGKITVLDEDEDLIAVNVAGEIYTFEMTDKFENQLESFRKKGHKIKVDTYVQIFYEEQIVEKSDEYDDVYVADKIADSFSIVYEN